MTSLTKNQIDCAAELSRAGLWPLTKASAFVALSITNKYGLEDEVFMLGAGELLRRWRLSDPGARETRQAAAVTATKRTVSAVATVLKPIIANQRKADENAKIVELLDSWMVGDVRLGDCTKDKLIAEAGKLAHAATTARRHAALYQKLAAVLKPGETVRKSAGRKALLAILQSVVS